MAPHTEADRDPAAEGEHPCPTRTQRRAAANRELVIDAAREIVVREGVAALTLEAVADRGRCRDPDHLQPGRRAVGRADGHRRAGNGGEPGLHGRRDAATGTPEDRILLAAAAYARFARERPHEFRLLVEPPDEPEAVARIVELTREQNAKLAEVLLMRPPPVMPGTTWTPTTSPPCCGPP